MNLESAQRVGVGNDTATIAHDRRSDRGVGQSSPLLVVRKGIGAVEVLFDDTGHTVLAMACYVWGAVVPARPATTVWVTPVKGTVLEGATVVVPVGAAKAPVMQTAAATIEMMECIVRRIASWIEQILLRI